MAVCPVLHSFFIDHESRYLLCLLLGQFNSHQILALCCSDMWHLFLLGRLQNLEKQHVSFFSVLFLSVKYAGQFGGICVVCALHHCSPTWGSGGHLWVTKFILISDEEETERPMAGNNTMVCKSPNYWLHVYSLGHLCYWPLNLADPQTIGLMYILFLREK